MRTLLGKLKSDFSTCRCDARKRGVEWLLTFEEWLAIWAMSGKLPMRGRGSDQYCMARYGDTGPYKVGNVRITTAAENNSEAHLGKPKSDQMRRRLSAAKTGVKRLPFSAQARENMRQGQLRRHAR